MQTPDTAENDVEILSETAVPSAAPTVSPSPAPAESEIQDQLSLLDSTFKDEMSVSLTA